MLGLFEKKHRLFVYGTLKRGHGLNGALGNSEFIKDGWLQGFKMYGSGVPVVIKTNNPEDKVYGEIFLVNSQVLGDVDVVEGHPYGYTRTWIEQLGGVWIYLGRECSVSLNNYYQPIENGIWEKVKYLTLD